MRRIAILTALSLLVAACATGGGGEEEGGGGSPEAVTAEMEGFAFAPEQVTVAAGGTVTWTNQDGVANTVTSDDDVFDSGSVDADGTFGFTFEEPGTYTYFCRIHPSMKGTVVVE